MKGKNLATILNGLCEESPARFVSLVRLAWPDIKAALDRGHSVKVIHDRFVKGGVRISYRLFAMYVGQLRRENSEKGVRESGTPDEIKAEEGARRNHGFTSSIYGDEAALVRVPKRRLFSARAAAQYLGIHEQTLKRITTRGHLQARFIGSRRVYRLEDLDRYIESLPMSA